MADSLQLPIHRAAGVATGPALGAARLAAVASGQASIADLSIRPVAERVFDPKATGAHVQGLSAYRALYLRLKGIHADAS